MKPHTHALQLIGAMLLCLLATRVQAQTGEMPITITFDNLPAGVIVSNQYQDYARFSSTGGYAIQTYSHVFYGTSLPWIGGSNSNFFATVIVDFTNPVNNLKYDTLATDFIGCPLANIDVYQNGVYTTTFSYCGNGTTPISTQFPGYNNITRIVIYNITDVAGLGYDNFSFTVPLAVNITNPRVSGNLNGTTQNALVGADVTLQANPNISGGTYAWSFTGSPTIVGGATNQSAVGVRWTQTGVYGATVAYTLNGVTRSASVNVNVIVPTLSVFSGNMVDVDQVTRGLPCSDQASENAKYSLGCASFRGSQPQGMVFNATANIPAGQYLTDLAQSGIKFRHFGSEFSRRKRDTYYSRFGGNPYNPYLDGRDQCLTGRTSKADIDSGWRSDGGEVFNGSSQPLPRFSAGNSISTRVFDLPSQYLDTPPGSFTGSSDMLDVQSLEVFFEMYVYYYTGDPYNPTFQQPMRLTTHSTPYSKIPWKWAGQAYFDAQNSPTVKYILQVSTTTPLGSVPAVPVSTPRAFNGSLNQNWVTCSDSPPTGNALDSVRFFVRNQYERILFRVPEDAGWDAWTSVVTRCAFDSNCINNNRNIVARGIFDSPEHLSREPALGTNPVGSPEYNRGYVRLCYVTYLGREPQNGEDQGWIDYINSTGDYTTLIGGFVNSPEYRGHYTGVIFP